MNLIIIQGGRKLTKLLLIILFIPGCIFCPDPNFCAHDLSQIGGLILGSGSILYYLRHRFNLIITQIKHLCTRQKCGCKGDKIESNINQVCVGNNNIQAAGTYTDDKKE